MVIALLTTIGIFAARSASMVDSASGYDRQASQAFYLAELSGRAAAVQFGDRGMPQYFVERLQKGSSAGTDECPSNQKLLPVAPNARLPCVTLDSEDLNKLVTGKSGHPMLDGQSASSAGSLGPPLGTGMAGGGLEGAFLVEMIDEPAPSAPVAGSDAGGGANSMMNAQVTLTAFAQVHNVPPTPGAQAWCTADSSSAGASIQALRAHVTLPNLPGQR